MTNERPQPGAAPDLSAFGACSVIAPLHGGHRQQVWLVERAGQRLVAKTNRRTAAQLEWLLPLQQAARDAGFVVPALLRSADGALSAQGLTLEPFIDGRPAQQANMAALLPRLQALHRTTITLPQRPGFASARELISAGGGGDIDMGLLPPDLAQACRAAWMRLTGAECAIHGDLSPANVLLTPEGPALLDWDEARRDLPIFDTMACRSPSPAQARAHLAWEVATCWQHEPDRARALACDLLAQGAASLSGTPHGA